MLRHLILHTLTFILVTNGYLLLVMIATSPRVWGHHDYPEVVRSKVPAQTTGEKALAVVIGVPWMLFVLGFPAFSTFALRAALGGDIPFLLAVVHPLILLELTSAVEVVLLDWFIISRLTPAFVIIPGTDREDYRDMSHHYKGHVRAAIMFLPISVIIGAVAYLA